MHAAPDHHERPLRVREERRRGLDAGGTGSLDVHIDLRTHAGTMALDLEGQAAEHIFAVRVGRRRVEVPDAPGQGHPQQGGARRLDAARHAVARNERRRADAERRAGPGGSA